jgi:hypothetical protein
MRDISAFVQKYLVAIIIGVLLLFAAGTCWRLKRAQGAVHEQAFKADSAIAAADTTRAVNERAKKVLGDSIRGVERRAWQAEIERNALDKALGRVTQALSNVTFALKELRASGATSRVLESDGVRTATFKVDSVPYHANATVALPPAPQPGRFTLSVKLDPATIGVRVQCGKAKGAGVRPATMTVTTPSWLTAQIDSPQFSPEVCNPEKPRSRWWWVPVSAGGGYLLGKLF